MTLSRLGFKVRAVYKLKKPSVFRLARQRISFLIASLSLFAFVIGNMVGQHGWYAFWKSVLGKEDDTQIAFVGMVPPIEKVPDYSKWAQYGGNPEQNTYRLVPQDVLVPLPSYDLAEQRMKTGNTEADEVFSVGNLGDYKTGADHSGSHPGVDIRVPQGTPVESIGNGIVEKTAMLDTGYGHYVIVRHPNVPDPTSPGKTTTIYSIYAHLDVILVVEGQVVHKGEQLATSGQTGLATGPHLHFQIDKVSAPFHPYWPFTSGEAAQQHLSFSAAINSGLHQERGDLYTISPLLMVQQYESYTPTSVVAQADGSAQNTISKLSPNVQIKQAVQDRLKARMARVNQTAPVSSSAASSVVALAQPEIKGQVSEVKTAAVEATSILPIVSGSNTDVDHLVIEHSGKLTRTWQRVKIIALDKNGQTVQTPSFGKRLYIVPEFGEAEIRPNELSSLDFVGGVATVSVLARSNKTLFIATRGAFDTISPPMVFAR
jgi:hypothetical protein